MTSTTASDVLIDSLHEWGVDTIFGLPGDGINGIMEALRTRADKIRFVMKGGQGRRASLHELAGRFVP
jgi:pyruvate dehydrogenase (quinone)/pyruvate oxidase